MLLDERCDSVPPADTVVASMTRDTVAGGRLPDREATGVDVAPRLTVLSMAEPSVRKGGTLRLELPLTTSDLTAPADTESKGLPG